MPIKVRVGQADAVKILSSAGGGSVEAFTAQNVIGGIASVTALDVTGISTFTGNINVSGLSTFSSNVSFASSALFGDNDKLLFGDGNDLELYHNGTASYIDNNTGPLYIRNNVNDDDGSNIIIQAKSGKTSAVFQDDEGVRLYYNDVEKFITTEDGIIISGISTATSFQGANATAASFPLGLTATNGIFSVNVSIG